jgi:hypothetical protein
MRVERLGAQSKGLLLMSRNKSLLMLRRMRGMTDTNWSMSIGRNMTEGILSALLCSCSYENTRRDLPA